MAIPALPATDLHYLHVSHCTFLISDGSASVLIDPFFSGQFEWNNRIERHLDKPAIPLEAFTAIDAILVSHEHSDHYDAATLAQLLKQTAVNIYAPRQVIDDAVNHHQLDRSRFIEVHRGDVVRFGDMAVTVYAAAMSEKTEPVDRVGFHVASGGSSIYHQGDSHGASPTWQPMHDQLDAFIMWPYRVQEVVLNVRPRKIIFHHLDRFSPGDFFCNRDAELELQYHRHYLKQVEFVVPQPGRWEKVR